jgi:hypothetical protein
VLVGSLVGRGDSADALRVAEETIVVADAWGDPWVGVLVRASMIPMRVSFGSYSLVELRTMAVETVGLARRIDNPTLLLFASFSLGMVESARDPGAAIGPFRESLEAADRGSGGYMVNVVAGELCRCYAAVGDMEGAADTIRRGIVIARDSGSRRMLAQILDNAGQALIILGRDQEGATLHAAGSRGQIGSRNLGGRSSEQRVAAQRNARARLGPNRYDDAVREGAAMTPEMAIVYALNVLDRLASRSDG